MDDLINTIGVVEIFDMLQLFVSVYNLLSDGKLMLET